MRDFIERLKAKPEHVRRRIALGTTLGITGVVTTAWFFTLLFGGTLSLAVPPSVVDGNGAITQAGTDPNASGASADSKSNFSQLLGAVGITTAKPAPAALQVEDAAPVTATATQPTVIPF